ncbi:MAG: hypothetical protein RBT81_03335 [Gammaproteobacteria bacterium]|jgi:hypothetical protein|nr:hypothetical protein [Gammaproteobacteria bacterium]
MKSGTAIACVFTLAIGTAGLTACDTQDGAFEQSGERIDRGIDNTRDSLNDAGERAGESIDNAGDRMRGLGDGNDGSADGADQ